MPRQRIQSHMLHHDLAYYVGTFFSKIVMEKSHMNIGTDRGRRRATMVRINVEQSYH